MGIYSTWQEGLQLTDLKQAMSKYLPRGETALTTAWGSVHCPFTNGRQALFSLPTFYE